MDSPRLLAVVTVPLWPAREGYSLRVANLLPELAREWAITLVAPSGEDPEGPSHAGISEFLAVSLPDYWTLSPSEYDNGRLRLTAHEAARRVRPDAALLWSGAEFLAFRPTALPPGVADRIDCRSLISWRRLLTADGMRGRLQAARDAVELARYERRVVRELYTTVVVGEDDARALRRLTGRGRIEVIPNGVAVDAPLDLAAEGPIPEVIFSGVMTYGPNIDAAIFFADKVWPRVIAAVPDARFVIAGREPPPELTRRGGRGGVEVRADVPSMRRTLAGAWVAVAPMRSGAGIKNKVLEAWAVGKPVVLTPLASNGLHLDDTARQLVLDDPDAMASAVIRLLRDPTERRRVGAAAHALARRAHTWGEAASRLSRILKSAALR